MPAVLVAAGPDRLDAPESREKGKAHGSNTVIIVSARGNVVEFLTVPSLMFDSTGQWRKEGIVDPGALCEKHYLRRLSILDATKAQPQYPASLQDVLRQRREAHCKALWEEVERLTQAAIRLGIQRVILFGSLVWGHPGLTSDVDLVLIWDTPLGFLERTAEVYRRLLPQVAADLFVYTPDELARMAHTPFIRRALAEGRVLYAA